jgi:hypothetical protein
MHESGGIACCVWPRLVVSLGVEAVQLTSRAPLLLSGIVCDTVLQCPSFLTPQCLSLRGDLGRERRSRCLSA